YRWHKDNSNPNGRISNGVGTLPTSSCTCAISNVPDCWPIVPVSTLNVEPASYQNQNRKVSSPLVPIVAPAMDGITMVAENFCHAVVRLNWVTPICSAGADGAPPEPKYCANSVASFLGASALAQKLSVQI